MPSYQVDEYGLSIGVDGKPPGGLKAEAVSARASVEAQVYSLLNPYLDQRQKAIVEVWYQLPMEAFFYSYLIFSAVDNDVSLTIKPVFLAIYISLFFGWLTTFFKESILQAIMPVFALAKNEIVQIFIMAIACFSGVVGWWSGIALIIIAFTGIADPGSQLATAWAAAKHPRMNPKYGAAKEIFGISEFPFEQYLEDNPTYDEAEAKGKSALCWVSLVLLVVASILWGGA